MLTDSFEVVCENIPNRRLVNIDEWNLEDCDLPVSSHFYEWVIVVEVLLLILLAVIFLKDWRNYRRTKNLPWISRHLPDWFPAFPSKARKISQGGKKNEQRVCISRGVTMREEDTPYAPPIVTPTVSRRRLHTQASHRSSELRDSIITRASLTLSKDRWSSASLSPKLRVKFKLDLNDVQRSKSSDQLQ